MKNKIKSLVFIMLMIASINLFGESSYTFKKTSANTYELTLQGALIGHIVYTELSRFGPGLYNGIDSYEYLDSEGISKLFGAAKYLNTFPTLIFHHLKSHVNWLENGDLIGDKKWKISASCSLDLHIRNLINCFNDAVATINLANREIISIRVNHDIIVQYIRSPDPECWEVIVSDKSMIPIEILYILGAFLDQTFIFWDNLGKPK